MSISGKSLTLNKSKALGTRDLGLLDDDSDVTSGFYTIIGEGDPITSISQRLEKRSRSYPSDWSGEGYTGSAGIRRIDACTVAYAYEDVLDEDDVIITRNELVMIAHYARHYINVAAEDEEVKLFGLGGEWHVLNPTLVVLGKIQSAWDQPAYMMTSISAGYADETTISAFGGDFLISHDPEITVSGSITGAGALPMF